MTPRRQGGQNPRWPRGCGSQSSPACCSRSPLGVSLTGCFGFLKPAKSTARHFVLTPLPAAEPAAAPRGSVAVGVGPVKLPAYLFNTSLAVRKGTNEIDYLPVGALGRAPGHRPPAGAGGEPGDLAAHGPDSPVRLAERGRCGGSLCHHRAVRRGRPRPGSARRLVAHPLAGRREDSQGRRDAVSRARARRRTPTRPAPSPR